jgi:hypothetical protein
MLSFDRVKAQTMMAGLDDNVKQYDLPKRSSEYAPLAFRKKSFKSSFPQSNSSQAESNLNVSCLNSQ